MKLPAPVPDLFAFMDELAEAARAEILPRFRQCDAENKAERGFDPVTEADRGAERAMRALIAARFPTHGIEGEEYGFAPSGDGFSWVLDPVDGTRAFISGLPSWGTLIALAYEDRPVLGVLDQGYLDERFYGLSVSPGEREAHALLRGDRSRLNVRPCPLLTAATLATTDANLFTPAEAGAFEQVRATARLTRYGFDCYAYAMVAAGHIDMVVEAGLKPHDIAAITPIIEGAGGLVTNWRGDPAWRGGQVIAAGDASAHAEAMVALRRSAAT
jgi:myo-inositol-1(or 4)-monophosphatase